MYSVSLYHIYHVCGNIVFNAAISFRGVPIHFGLGNLIIHEVGFLPTRSIGLVFNTISHNRLDNPIQRPWWLVHAFSLQDKLAYSTPFS